MRFVLGLRSICYEPLLGEHGDKNARKAKSKCREPEDVDHCRKDGLLESKNLFRGWKVGQIREIIGTVESFQCVGREKSIDLHIIWFEVV